ncbi:MAG TPA: GxxExxY protein [Dehalococcoidia bacterium]|nr:GxxExxY protein [Dehalococcoidia bacterium]
MASVRLPYSEVTQAIIGCAYEVHRQLGAGFLEKVYANALKMELEGRSLGVVAEAAIDVLYKGRLVGVYYADLLVEGQVICEVKAVRDILPEHEAQLIHYLKGTARTVGLLINFGGPSLKFKRMVFTPEQVGGNPR